MKRSFKQRWIVPLAFAFLFCTRSYADELQLLWQISPDERPYIGINNTERGVAYNPVTGHVLVVSRNGGNFIYILNGQTGEEIGILNPQEGLSGPGTFPVNMIGVADDGAIYAANLSTATPPNFRLYRWENEAALEPTIAFDGDPAGLNNSGVSNNQQRWGDSLDVRGAGVNTQVLLGSNAGTVAALLTTSNGTDFTSKLISNVSLSGATGVAFGSGNTLWAKKTGVGLRQVSFNATTGAGTLVRTVAASVIPNTVAPIAVNVSSNWLAAISINTGVDDLRLYDISDPAGIFIVDQVDFPVDQANGNAAGAIDFGGDLLFALDTNNGLVAYRIIRTVTAPGFANEPASSSVLDGGYLTLSANVTGTRPIGFQWQFNGSNVLNATNATLSLTNISATSAGDYTLVASNASGTATSAVATVTVIPTVRSGILTPLWNLTPGSRPYLTTGNLERGLAYNPVNGHVLLMSRAGGNNIYVLDGETGAELWKLQVPTDVIAGGTFLLNMVAVADDGAVYAANLVTSGSAFAIYRWENDTTNSVPTVAFAGAPSGSRRWGDTLDARGAGTSTQLLLASNISTDEPDNTAVVFTTFDGVNFDPNPIVTTGVNDQAFQLGIAFGEGNTFWGKAPNYPLQQVSFDLGAGTGTISRTISNIPNSAAPLGVLVSSNLLGLIAFENPDNLRLYDTSGTGTELTLVDQEILPTDNANGNGVGSVAFGSNRLYVLDTNNGIQAYMINAASSGMAATLSSPAMNAGTFSFLLKGSPNSNYQIQATADFAAWTNVKTVSTGAAGDVQVTDNSAQQYRFYRAVAQ